MKDMDTGRTYSDKVLLWVVDCFDLLDKLEGLKKLLSIKETHRAMQFKSTEDCDRYVCAHGFLRMVLSHYTGRSPNQHAIVERSSGKPYLGVDKHIGFSLSHSGNMIAVGIVNNGEVGVDIEKVILLDDMDCFAQRVLTHSEYRSYDASRGQQRAELFYKFWVQKESVAKAWGVGIANVIGPADLEMVKSDKGFWVKRTVNSFATADVWSGMNFRINKSFVGAACIKGDNIQIEIMNSQYCKSIIKGKALITL